MWPAKHAKVLDMVRGRSSATLGRPPVFLRFRSSTGFIAFVVALGILTDISGYGLIVPVTPFRLQNLGYQDVGAKTGWLVAACFAGGIVISSPPIAWLGSKFRSRRGLLVLFLFSMIGGIILFMETASFATMAIARVLQGFSATGIWTLGLSLVTDSVPESRVGAVLGSVMIGFSLGTLIGPPVGGVLYARIGYRAPFVFALILLFIDLVLRLLVIEKHVALKWIEAGIEIPGFEAPGYTPPEPPRPNNITDEIEMAPSPIPLVPVSESAPAVPSAERDRTEPASPWNALLDMMTNPRAVTSFALTILNGIVLGGTLDTGMTLWLQHQYGLTSLGAGLAFMGAVIPTFIFVPLAGWGADKYGAKWICLGGLFFSIPTYLLLIIEGPLPLFIFFLTLFGVGMSLFLSPTMQDLAIVLGSTPGLPASAVHGAFNMFYSIGAFIGPIIGGQLISALQIRDGWIALCALSSGLSLLLVPPVVIYLGGPLKRRRKETEEEESNRP